jgi:hypothetical protein
MSQEAVERLLGRLITDEHFRRRAMVTLEETCLREGYALSKGELSLLAGLQWQPLAALGAGLASGLCRAHTTGQDSG